MAYLNNAFVRKQLTNLEKYKQIMENIFLVELNDSPQYIELQNSKGFLEWFECKISDVATNLLHWCEFFYPQKDKAEWTTKVVDLWNTIFVESNGGPNFWRIFWRRRQD